MNQTALIHVVDDDESLRAALLDGGQVYGSYRKVHQPLQEDAAYAAGAEPDRFRWAAARAKAAASTAADEMGKAALQLHGGIGFTWEHPAHLYFKRAKTCEAMFGTPGYHRDLLAARLGLEA